MTPPQSGSTQLRAGTVLDGRFEIIESIGAGGMSIVYRALDRVTSGPVAVKILAGHDPHEVERFTREAHILAALSHVGIVKYVTHGVSTDGVRYLVEEWLAGQTLGGRLAATGLSVGETLAIARRLATALAGAHRAGIIHRDIKPDNLVLPEGRIEELTIIDFGVARRAQESAGVTSTGMVVGTPGYMAPEQARGTRAIDERADLFAVGCVLYECLTGRAAFAGENLVAVRTKILLVDPPPLEELCPEAPAPLVALLRTLLAKDPADRPGSAAAVAVALADLTPPAVVHRRRVRGAEPPTHAMPIRLRKLGGSDVEAALCFVVLVAPPDAEPTGAAQTASIAARGAHEDVLAAAAAPFQARLEFLEDGAVAAILQGKGAEQADAARAARCALALRACLPGRPVALCAGRGTRTDARDVLEAVIDDCVSALGAVSFDRFFPDLQTGTADTAVRLGGALAELLHAGFDVQADDAGDFLLAERTPG